MTTTLGLRDQLPYLPRALGLVWRAAPGWTAVWSLLLFVQGVLPVAVVYTTRAAVDRLAEALAGPPSPESLQSVIVPALMLAGLFLLSEVLRAGTRFVRSTQAELVRDHISALVHAGTIEADLAQFESPAFHDRLFRARMDSHERPIALIQGLGSFVQSSITLAAMAVVLIPYGWWVPLALLASTAPALIVVARYALIHHRWTVDATPRSRRTWYYDWLLSTRETASEIRLFGIGPRFSEAFQSIRRQLRRERLVLTRAEAVSEIAAGGFALLVSGGLAVWMIVRTVDGANSLGDLALFLQAFTHGQRLMRSLLETVGTVWSNLLFLDNLFGFLDMEPQITEPVQPQAPPAELPPGLAFRSVSFTYPGTPKPVFEGLDLEVAPGATAALLGVNGAGKSTLIKLLCRFYDPDLGTVEIGGTDLKTMEISELRRLISALFQEPVHYSETAEGNLAVADHDHETDPERLRAAVRFAGAEQLIEKLPEGLQTLLGTWFSGGAELSVGEWQRLALARALVRDAPVLLLDEPTSAMDSWSEARWSERLSKIALGRTVLIITHRLTTAMHADRIHVMDGGRIVESGSHEELLSAQGDYWNAWNAQFGG